MVQYETYSKKVDLNPNAAKIIVGLTLPLNEKDGQSGQKTANCMLLIKGTS